VLEGRLEAGDCEDADGFLFDVWSLETDVLRRYLIASRGEYHPYIWILEDDCTPRTTYLGNSFSALGGTLTGGRYKLVVAGFEPGEGGSYTINFNCNEHDVCREACLAGTLECGQTATGVLTRDDCAYFTTILDVWELSVPPLSEATIDVSGPNGRFLSWSLLPASCAAFPDLRPICDFPEGAPDVCRLPAGDYLLYVGSITNVVFQLGDQPYEVRVTTSLCDASGRQLPGDCNQDRRIDLSDAVCLLAALFRGHPARLSCGEGELGANGSALLDWDGDARLAITDAVLALQFLFDAGPPHALGLECLPAAGCPDACGG
jgi:hypothetical protein